MRSLVIVAALLASACVVRSERLVALEKSLNDALPGDAPITLRKGNNFEAPPGRVIFISREEGALRLIDMARSGKDELSLFYLPYHDAWITETIKRTVDTTESETRFCEAAMASEPEVHLWHFHNDKPNGELAGYTPAEVSLMWTVPGPMDLEEMYAWAELNPKAKFRGFVVSTHGVMEYWADGYATGVRPDLVRRALMSESWVLKHKAREAGADGLYLMALNHRGMFNIRYRPVP